MSAVCLFGKKGGMTSEQQPSDTHDASGIIIPSCGLVDGEPHVLLCGIDSLYVNYYVEWNGAWRREHGPCLAEAKQLAIGRDKYHLTGSRLGENMYVYPGRRNNYAYIVRSEEGGFYFIDDETYYQRTPNVLIEPNARLLWDRGPVGTVRYFQGVLEDAGATVVEHQISRCDMCADFLLPHDLCDRQLMDMLVSRATQEQNNYNKKQMETFYVGTRGGPIQLRIYDKTKEVLANKDDKSWLLDLWGHAHRRHVWRVEFQLNRTALKQMKVSDIASLQSKTGGIWDYLSKRWVSFRFLDNPQVSRRTMDPFWQGVIDLADCFGPACTVERNMTRKPQPLEKILPNIHSRALTVGGIKGFRNSKEVFSYLNEEFDRCYPPHEYRQGAARVAVERDALWLDSQNVSDFLRLGNDETGGQS